jgi:hypothetical protein
MRHGLLLLVHQHRLRRLLLLPDRIIARSTVLLLF